MSKTMSDDAIISKFKKAKIKLHIALLFCLLCFFVGPLLMYFDINVVNPLLLSLVGVIAFSFVTFKFYRCPNCNSVPPSLGGEGIPLNPKNCGRCGVLLK
jgi:hypothetical protein